MKYPGIGQRINAALTRKAWTQGDLAERCGPPITQQTVSKIVGQEIPGTKHLATIAARLGVPVEWLTSGDNAPPWAASIIDMATQSQKDTQASHKIISRQLDGKGGAKDRATLAGLADTAQRRAWWVDGYSRGLTEGKEAGIQSAMPIPIVDELVRLASEKLAVSGLSAESTEGIKACLHSLLRLKMLSREDGEPLPDAPYSEHKKAFLSFISRHPQKRQPKTNRKELERLSELHGQTAASAKAVAAKLRAVRAKRK